MYFGSPRRITLYGTTTVVHYWRQRCIWCKHLLASCSYIDQLVRGWWPRSYRQDSLREHLRKSTSACRPACTGLQPQVGIWSYLVSPCWGCGPEERKRERESTWEQVSQNVSGLSSPKPLASINRGGREGYLYYILLVGWDITYSFSNIYNNILKSYY
jgi:hypothetical protein